MPVGKGRKENTAGTAPRASWNSTCDSKLIECLEKQKENGRMTSNSSWHSAAWVEAEKALTGTEQTSGGGKKTALSCQNRRNAVCSSIFIFFYWFLFAFLEIYVLYFLAQKRVCAGQTFA